MAVYDVDGDGDNDVVSSLAAHQYGLAWFEQRKGESPEFVAHEILPPKASADNAAIKAALGERRVEWRDGMDERGEKNQLGRRAVRRMKIGIGIPSGGGSGN